MTRRYFLHCRFFLRLFVSLGVTLAYLLPSAACADNITVQQASLGADASGGWSLTTRFQFKLSDSLKDAVNKGIPLYFTTHFQLTEQRWYWFDEPIVDVAQSVRLSFKPLTNEYWVSSVSNGGLQLRYSTLESALKMIQYVSSWHVLDRNQVQPGILYTAAVRMELDTALMSKLFQIDAVNNSEWNLASDWKQFPFQIDRHDQ